MNAHDSERIKGMLESLGLGEAASPGRGRRRRLQHVHDPREARPAARRAPRAGEGAEGPRPGAGDRGRRLLRRGAAGADLRAVPVRRRRVRARARSRISASGSGPAAQAPRGALRHERSAASPATCRSTASGAFQAWVQVSMGCNSKCAYCIVPAVRGREQSRRPGDIVAEVDGARRRRRARDHAARPERQLVRPRPPPGDPDRVRRAAARLRRGRRDRADPLHEPAPEGLPART